MRANSQFVGRIRRDAARGTVTFLGDMPYSPLPGNTRGSRVQLFHYRDKDLQTAYVAICYFGPGPNSEELDQLRTMRWRVDHQKTAQDPHLKEAFKRARRKRLIAR